ncbi:aspartate--tRNA ligase, mitochondrial-like [Symsagittifera roscoffensis]|uniref:aspartate--tRNA ligase, mitochondrial-like n=1 Tax=Symsagittifera roscoffensis TaxID=84072 RepID=UPI00307B1E06
MLINMVTVFPKVSKYLRNERLLTSFLVSLSHQQNFYCAKPTIACKWCHKAPKLQRKALSFKSPHVQVDVYRTLNCDQVSGDHVDTFQVFSGWVKYIRNVGKSDFGFLVLTDHTGELQFVFRKENSGLENKSSHSNDFCWSKLTIQSAVTLRGQIKKRPLQDVNSEMKTGAFEVSVSEVLFFNYAAPVPFNIHKPQSSVREDIRLQYRYLDLRRPEMQQMLRLRSSTIHKMRRILVEDSSFTEVETPTLFRSSPGGAKEFLVPSQQPEHYYALTQSPQQLKQLLMVGMVDRYFQFARCYRDECQFSDRQLEFTQLDLEVSFESKEFIQGLIEKLIVETWPEKSCGDKPIIPFKRMSYDEVFCQYGTDKPDLRYPEVKLTELPTDILRGLKSNAFDQNLSIGCPGYGMLIKNGQKLTRSAINKIVQSVEKEVRWMVSLISIGENGRWHHHSFQNADDALVSQLNEFLKCENGDIILLSVGPKDLACTMLGRLRVRLIEKLADVSKIYQRDPNDFKFLWVEDFPLFEQNSDDPNKWVASHHPFTAPHLDDVRFLRSDPAKVRGQHFDLVLNGNEIAGGSMRISDSEVQRLVLEDILKLDCSNFQYLIDALSFGAPVHGGIAIGLDRYFAVLLGKSSIRDVIAFPKSSKTGACLMSDAPSRVDQNYQRES